MIGNIIAWSLRNRFLVGLATFALLAGGIWAIATTPIDALPDLSDVGVRQPPSTSASPPEVSSA